jgi:hypothetical protein
LRFEGITIPPRPAQKLSKEREVRLISFPWLVVTPYFRQKGREENSKIEGVVFLHLTQGILTKWTDLSRAKDK